MRFEKDSLTITNVDWMQTGDVPKRPSLNIRWASPPRRPGAGVKELTDSRLDEEVIDVTFRYQPSKTDTASQGVLGVSNNITGEFLLEVTTEGDLIREFVDAARRYAEVTDDHISYEMRMWTEDGLHVTYEKQLFLVYASDGILLRHFSLIPNGVEM